MKRVFLPIYFIVYLSMISIDVHAADNNPPDISDSIKTIFAKKFYKDSEKHFKKDFESIWNIDFEQKIQNEAATPLATRDISNIKHEILEFIYWSAIDSMSCQEETLSALSNTDLLSSALESLENCRDNRRKLTQEMHALIGHYVTLDRERSNISMCLVKSEMLQIEQRYPPYDWMKLEGYAPPRAYDAKTFLDCAKKNMAPNRDSETAILGR